MWDGSYSLIAGTFTSIDFPGAAVTSARGINDNGDIVGFLRAINWGHEARVRF
jgi:hypothetical protein